MSLMSMSVATTRFHCPRWSRVHVKWPAEKGRDDVNNLGPGHMNVTRKPEPYRRVVVLAVPISFCFFTPKPS